MERMGSARSTVQPFGHASKQALSDAVFDKDVVIEWNKRDRFARIVGKVLIGSIDASLAQVNASLAWHYKKYEGTIRRG
jgi:endonuclease YncB( thermonuclease family)